MVSENSYALGDSNIAVPEDGHAPITLCPALLAALISRKGPLVQNRLSFSSSLTRCSI